MTSRIELRICLNFENHRARSWGQGNATRRSEIPTNSAARGNAIYEASIRCTGGVESGDCSVIPADVNQERTRCNDVRAEVDGRKTTDGVGTLRAGRARGKVRELVKEIQTTTEVVVGIIEHCRVEGGQERQQRHQGSCQARSVQANLP